MWYAISMQRGPVNNMKEMNTKCPKCDTNIVEKKHMQERKT
jgi:hypothetical protein